MSSSIAGANFRIEKMFAQIKLRTMQLARRKPLAILAVGLAPMIVRALLLPVFPMPAPRIHDEFSHLLAADTFAHGRLVNPVHPLWVHFDSMHILVRPVYASVYPVAQGAILAAGQVLSGHPWAGVWFSVGMMCAALCWMLQGWVSPGWALLGAVLAAARFGVFSYWMNSYYGGAVAAAAGALALGALPRIMRRRRWQDAAVMAAGLAVLANTRPYEGFVFSLPLLTVLLIWGLKSKALSLRLALAPSLILCAIAAGMGYYFSRFSGSPFIMPYQLFRNNFTMAPFFIWQPPRPEPLYYHRATRAYYANWEMASYLDARAGRAPHGVLDKAISYSRFYFGPFLALPLLAIPWLCRRRRTRFLLLCGLLFSSALLLEVWQAPHYAAPAMGLVLLLIVEGLRHVRQGYMGAWMVGALCLACFLSPVIHGGIRVGDGRARASFVDRLLASGERHLVLVRYVPTHDPGDEWVYNGADIDGSRVVWAREMDPTSNRNLLRYFKGRRVWLVEPDSQPPRLSQYDSSMLPDPPFAFVRLGAEAIEALRSPEQIRRNILRKVANERIPADRLNCDGWNYLFIQVTGIAAPDASHGCFSAGNRARPVEFDQWFEWLLRQK